MTKKKQHPNPARTFLVIGLFIAGVLLVNLLSGPLTISSAAPAPTVEPTATSVPDAPKEVRLVLAPAPGTYTEQQKKYQRMSIFLPKSPQSFGLDTTRYWPLENMDEQALIVFWALIGTETNWNHYWPDGSIKYSPAPWNCIGVGQICNTSHCHPDATQQELMDDAVNMWYAACHFAYDLERADGDYALAVAFYKGATICTDGTYTCPDASRIIDESVAWQVDTVFERLTLKRAR